MKAYLWLPTKKMQSGFTWGRGGGRKEERKVELCFTTPCKRESETSKAPGCSQGFQHETPSCCCSGSNTVEVLAQRKPPRWTNHPRGATPAAAQRSAHARGLHHHHFQAEFHSERKERWHP